MASWGLDRVWRRSLTRELLATCSPGGVVLDFGCGTGDLIFDTIQQKQGEGLKFLGMDLSLPMLSLAREKIGPKPLLVQASCEKIPLADQSVDSVISAFVLRNVRKIMAETLGEIRRVLKPGGEAHLLEMGVPKARILRPFHRLYLQAFLPLIGRAVFGEAWSRDYLAETIFQFWTPPEFCRLLTDAGFGPARYEPLSMGLAGLYHCRKIL